MTSELPASESLFSGKNSQSTLSLSRELQIMFEYETLVHYTPPGVFVIPHLKSIYSWFGIILLRSGPYSGNVFKFTIEIPTNYPLSVPKVLFNSHVFHPLVSIETGELNLAPRFPSWRAKKDFIFMVLVYVKSVFLQKDFWTEPFIKNKQAFDCYKNDQALRDQQRKFLEKTERPSQGILHKFQVNEKPDEHTELVLQMFRELESQDASEFLEWFNDRYKVNS